MHERGQNMGGSRLERGRRTRILVVGIAALLVAGWITAFASVGAGASGSHRPAVMPANPPALKVSASDMASVRSKVMSYWTLARMKAAKPLALGVSVPAGSVNTNNAGATATGNPGVAGGILPGGVKSKTAATTGFDANSLNSNVSPDDGAYPGPNDTYNWVGKQTAFPISTVGKLFFTEPGGDYVCSASATYGSSAQPNMVWTAGHCVGAQGGESYYSNWEFCPEYSNGPNAAVGCWTWSQAQLTGGWYYDGYWSADYAYLFMGKNGTVVHKAITKVVGGMGFAWNWSRDQFWQDLGYPSASPYSGNYLAVTSAEHRYDVTNPNGTAGSDPGQEDDSIGSSPTPGLSA